MNQRCADIGDLLLTITTTYDKFGYGTSRVAPTVFAMGRDFFLVRYADFHSIINKSEVESSCIH